MIQLFWAYIYIFENWRQQTYSLISFIIHFCQFSIIFKCIWEHAYIKYGIFSVGFLKHDNPGFICQSIKVKSFYLLNA